MESSLPNTKRPLALSLFIITTLLCMILPLRSSAAAADLSTLITYHGGPLLSGEVSLTVLWYGQFQPIEKTVVRTFIDSLTLDRLRGMYFQPHVSSWWGKVESYVDAAAQENTTAAANRRPIGKKVRVSVRIAKEVDDENASVGKVLVSESLPGLLQKATTGLPNTVAVIFAAKDVTVLDTCSTGTCFQRGVLGKQIYIVVGNPEEKCPGVCAVPFHRSDNRIGRPAALTLEPPSGDVGADTLVIQFASALAETVTNPFNSAFFGFRGTGGSNSGKTFLQVTSTCAGLFASGAVPGYPGNVRVDPETGGAFNAHGFNNTKFLLPALWDLKTASCWTTL